jgi:alkenylglycerophosphocholine hydrolase
MENFLNIPAFKYLMVVFVLILGIREYVTYKGNLFLKYIFTPLVTASVISFCVLAIITGNDESYSLLILSSLVLSIVADTLLMLEGTELFKHGLIYFLVAHILYLSAFLQDYSFTRWNILIILFMLVYFIPLYNMLKNRVGELFVPVMVYMGVIAVMVYFALSGLNRDLSFRYVSAAAGAVLFLISDTVLSRSIFVKKIPYESVIVWALYAPGQLLIALSCF